MPGSKPGALPLGERPKNNLAEDTGLEPVGRINDHGLANRSITSLAIFQIFPVTSSGAAQSLRSVSTLHPCERNTSFLEAEAGFEPAISGL